MSKLLMLVMLLVYLAFASQLITLWRTKRYGQFFLRLLLAPVILLFDWPIQRTQWKRPP
jgi:hypothetical protein